jgi:hypothetical protein
MFLRLGEMAKLGISAESYKFVAFLGAMATSQY